MRNEASHSMFMKTSVCANTQHNAQKMKENHLSKKNYANKYCMHNNLATSVSNIIK